MYETCVGLNPAPPRHQGLGEARNLTRGDARNRDVGRRAEQVLRVPGAFDGPIMLGAPGARVDVDGQTEVVANGLENQDQLRLGKIQTASTSTIEILDERSSLKVSRVYPPSSDAGG